jgi:hypothetical protein
MLKRKTTSKSTQAQKKTKFHKAKEALLQEKHEIKRIGYTKELKQWKEKYTHTNSNGELECTCGKIMNASACGEYHVFTHLAEGDHFRTKISKLEGTSKSMFTYFNKKKVEGEELVPPLTPNPA